MKKILTGALAALTLGGVVLGGATEASARPWGHGYGYGGAAVAAGIAGLAIGAALASDHGGNYGPAPVYYAGPPPAYYAGPAYYSYYDNCRTEWRWSPRWGRYERIHACY